MKAATKLGAAVLGGMWVGWRVAARFSDGERATEAPPKELPANRVIDSGRAEPSIRGGEEDFGSVVSAARRQVGAKMAGSVLVAVAVTGIFQAVFNQEAFTGAGSALGRLRMGTGITAPDATVIVLGVLTVISALSIALVTVTVQGNPSDVEEFAALSVWGQFASVTTVLLSVVALGTAFTQGFAVREERQPVLVLVLVMLSLVGVFLSAAVTTWVGAKEQAQWDLRRRYAHLVSRLHKVRAADSPRMAASIHRRYVTFVLSVAVLTTIAVFAGRLLFVLLTTESVPWSLRNVGLLPVAGLLVWITVGVTISRWNAGVELSAFERWTAPIPRLALGLLLTVSLGYGGLTSASLATGISVTVLWIGTVLLPGLLLLAARRLGRGPATFAVHRHLMWMRARQARMETELDESQG